MRTLGKDPDVQSLNPKYRRADIVAGRYKTKERALQLEKAHRFVECASKFIVGQEAALYLIQERAIQYLESYGSRQQEPVVVNLMGLPGVGKSTIYEALQRCLDLDFAKLDMQTESNSSKFGDTMGILSKSNRPNILLIDEVDKIAEFKDGKITDDTNALRAMGVINGIFTDGKFRDIGFNLHSISNTFIITAMNLSPLEMEVFLKELNSKPENQVKPHKTYYDLTVEDFAEFDRWIRRDLSANPKLLSRLFRPNTVSRLSPNAVVLKPFTHEDYKKIIEGLAIKTLQRLDNQDGRARQITAFVTPELIHFLESVAVYAPSGARDSVQIVDRLVEQLYHFAVKATDEILKNQSLGQPRSIELGYDESTGKARLNVQSLTYSSREKKWHASAQSTLMASYDPNLRLFQRPDSVQTVQLAALQALPKATRAQLNTTKPVRVREILDARFPPRVKKIDGLSAFISTRLVGTEKLSLYFEKQFGTFLSKRPESLKHPFFTVLPGFQGTGKTDFAVFLAEFMGWPIARVNLQAFSSSDDTVSANFLIALSNQINVAKSKAKEGPYLLLIEEMDKVFEVDPRSGALVNRPVMTHLKELLSQGRLDVTLSGRNGAENFKIDIRQAYALLTMNFGDDLFGFKADPRITTVDDVMKAWESMQSPSALKGLLSRLFLPETVSRILPRTKIMKPQEMPEYLEIIRREAPRVAHERTLDSKTERDTALIRLKITPAYLEYLYHDCVIPSEGGRYSVMASHARMEQDLEQAIQIIPRSSPLAKKPVEVILDFQNPDGHSPAVSASVRLSNGDDTTDPVTALQGGERKLYTQPVTLTFPPLDAQGRIARERLIISSHEFGHAFVGARLGLRFERIVVVPPQKNIGGYVKFRSIETHNLYSTLSEVLSLLGSRALERIVFSESPAQAASTLDITSGSNQDLIEATFRLFRALHENGYNLHGMAMDRLGVRNGQPYANFAGLSSAETQSIGHILGDLETFLVNELLKAHSLDWYRMKIAVLARQGELLEKDFYSLIEYQHPGDNSNVYGDATLFADRFADAIEAEPTDVIKARHYRNGALQTTASENYTRAFEIFKQLLTKYSNPIDEVLTVKACSDLLKVSGFQLPQ